MVTTATTGSDSRSDRAVRLLARARRRQLDLAIRGRVFESGRYARFAQRIRRKGAGLLPPSALPLA